MKGGGHEPLAGPAEAGAKKSKLKSPTGRDRRQAMPARVKPRTARAVRRILGSTIVVLRSSRGWDQAQLARAAGLPQHEIAAYEQGRRLPQVEAIQSLLEATGFHHVASQLRLHVPPSPPPGDVALDDEVLRSALDVATGILRFAARELLHAKRAEARSVSPSPPTPRRRRQRPGGPSSAASETLGGA